MLLAKTPLTSAITSRNGCTRDAQEIMSDLTHE